MKILMVVVLMSLLGCTQNERARSWGGTATVKLVPGRKLVTMTWKNSELWILTKQMPQTESPETYEFIESSNWGMVEGKVVVVETRF